MATDYRILCVKLFGTDDVEELRDIAGKAARKNPCGARRKKRFSENEAAGNSAKVLAAIQSA